MMGARACLALLALPFLVACLGPGPRDHFYRPAAIRPSEPLAEPILQGSLEVERLRADALTRERAILWVDDPESVQVTPYAYHLWIDSPTVMIQRDLADFLRLAGVAERVVLPEMNVDEAYELFGWIERLVHVTGNDSVVVEIEFSLAHPRGGGQIMERRYRVEQAVAGSGMDAAAEAFSSALQQIFDRLVADIAATAG